MSLVIFKDYMDGSFDLKKLNEMVDKELQQLEISYDGGRFNVYINGVVVYNNSCAGNDFSFTLKVKE